MTRRIGNLFHTFQPVPARVIVLANQGDDGLLGGIMVMLMIRLKWMYI